MFTDFSMSISLQVDDIISFKLMNCVNLERVLFSEGINNDCMSLKVIRGLTDDTEQLS